MINEERCKTMPTMARWYICKKCEAMYMIEFKSIKVAHIVALFSKLGDESIPLISKRPIMKMETSNRNYFGYVQVENILEMREAAISPQKVRNERKCNIDFIEKNKVQKRKSNSVSIPAEEETHDGSETLKTAANAEPLSTTKMVRVKGIYKTEAKRIRKFIMGLKGLIKGKQE